MTKFFEWPSDIASEQQKKHRYEILDVWCIGRAYSNKLPVKDSEYWNRRKYLIWDIQEGGPIYYHP